MTDPLSSETCVNWPCQLPANHTGRCSSSPEDPPDRPQAETEWNAYKSSNEIVDRLKRVLATAGSEWDGRPFCADALAEIDRLTRERDEAIKYRDDEFELRDRLANENQRLRAAPEQVKPPKCEFSDDGQHQCKDCDSRWGPAVETSGVAAAPSHEVIEIRQDYRVQCRCGWMGHVSQLKSLPEFKMGCPDCSAEFVPLDKMTFPVRAVETDACPECGAPNGHTNQCVFHGQR